MTQIVPFSKILRLVVIASLLPSCGTEHINTLKVVKPQALAQEAEAEVVQPKEAGSVLPDGNLGFRKKPTINVDDERQGRAIWSRATVSLFDPFSSMPDTAPGKDKAELLSLLGTEQKTVDPVCRGPWRYTTFDCFKVGYGPECGIAAEEQIEEIVEYNGCALPAFGIAGFAVHSEEFVDQIYNDSRPKDWCKDDGLKLDHGDLIADVTRRCSERAQKQLRETGDNTTWVECYNVHRRYVTGSKKKTKDCDYQKKYNTTFVMWSGDLRKRYPIYHRRDSDPACGRKMPIRHRKLQDRSFGTCRHPSFGRESSNVCRAPESLVVSALGLKRSDLHRDHFAFREDNDESALCTTCNTLPYENDGEIAAKLECLNEQHNFFLGLKQEAERRNLSAEETLPEDALLKIRETATALFEAVHSAKLSGWDFLQFYHPDGILSPRQTTSEVYSKEERVAMERLCLALLGTHVDSKRIVSEYKSCLSLATPTDGEPPLQTDIKIRTEAMKLAMHLFARYVGAMEDGDVNTLFEMDSAQVLMQSWYDHATTTLTHLPIEDLESARDLMQAYARKRL